jgi:MbtH protein
MESQEYIVVMNHEEQYSIWPSDKIVPAGWIDVGCMGSKEHCLEYVSKHWTDMRPASLRHAMSNH